ncbi:MAG: hypothetical protein ACYTFQ_30050, partial [Planctomycetota bacterium]
MLEFFKARVRPVVRPIALTVLFPILGLLICFLAEKFLEIEVPSLVGSAVNLVLAALGAFFLFPHVFGIPFGKIKTADFNRRIGFYLHDKAWKHVLLGVALAA